MEHNGKREKERKSPFLNNSVELVCQRLKNRFEDQERGIKYCFYNFHRIGLLLFYQRRQRSTSLEYSNLF